MPAIYDLAFDVFSEPERVSFPSVAFKTAAWYWLENAYVIKDLTYNGTTNLNEFADGTFFGFTQLTHSLTKKLKNLKDRAVINENILMKFTNLTAMRRGEGISCKLIDGTVGYAVPICLIDFKRPYCGCEGRMEIQSCPYGRSSTGSCKNSAMIKCCVEKCTTDLDLVIIVDSSASINYYDETNFDKVKNFTRGIVGALGIGQSRTRVALINYSTNAKVVMLLANGTDRKVVNKAIDDLIYMNGNFIFK